MYDDAYFHNTQVQIISIDLGDSFTEDIAPLVDALDDQFMFINVTRSHSKPPAAGAGPVAQLFISFVRDHHEAIKTVGLAGLGIYAAGFIQKMGEDTWDAVRKRLAAATRKEMPPKSVRSVVPLVVEIDRPRLVFDEPLEDDEFDRRLAAAADFVQTLPEESLGPCNGPPDHDWYYWSNKNNSWARMNDRQTDEVERWLNEHPEINRQDWYNNLNGYDDDAV